MGTEKSHIQMNKAFQKFLERKRIVGLTRARDKYVGQIEGDFHRFLVQKRSAELHATMLAGPVNERQKIYDEAAA